MSRNYILLICTSDKSWMFYPVFTSFITLVGIQLRYFWHIFSQLLMSILQNLVTQVQYLGRDHLPWFNISEVAQVFSSRLPINATVIRRIEGVLCKLGRVAANCSWVRKNSSRSRFQKFATLNRELFRPVFTDFHQ